MHADRKERRRPADFYCEPGEAAARKFFIPRRQCARNALSYLEKDFTAVASSSLTSNTV